MMEFQIGQESIVNYIVAKHNVTFFSTDNYWTEKVSCLRDFKFVRSSHSDSVEIIYKYTDTLENLGNDISSRDRVIKNDKSSDIMLAFQDKFKLHRKFRFKVDKDFDS